VERVADLEEGVRVDGAEPNVERLLERPRTSLEHGGPVGGWAELPGIRLASPAHEREQAPPALYRMFFRREQR